jgi:hypothetical protein
MYNSHSHRVLLWVHPKPGSTAEATECPLPIVLDHRSLQSFSCRCGCNFPAAQHGADPTTNFMPNPMLFSKFYYSFKRGTVRGPSTRRKAPSAICLVFHCILHEWDHNVQCSNFSPVPPSSEGHAHLRHIPRAELQNGKSVNCVLTKKRNLVAIPGPAKKCCPPIAKPPAWSPKNQLSWRSATSISPVECYQQTSATASLQWYKFMWPLQSIFGRVKFCAWLH